MKINVVALLISCIWTSYSIGIPIQETTTLSDTTTTDQTETYEEELENPDLFEGDILTTNSTEPKNGTKTRNAIIDPNLKWSNAIVPYEISSDFDSNQQDTIMAAINDYNYYTKCVYFVPRAWWDYNYVYIQPHDQWCNSYVGCQGNGQQEVNLASGCAGHKASVIHELMHAIGFWHEQSRSDRDSYVTIQWDNIQESNKHNFNKYSDTEVQDFGLAYDIYSVMHYFSTAFSKNGQNTITAINGDTSQMGRSSGLTSLDIQKIDALYTC